MYFIQHTAFPFKWSALLKLWPLTSIYLTLIPPPSRSKHLLFFSRNYQLGCSRFLRKISQVKTTINWLKRILPFNGNKNLFVFSDRICFVGDKKAGAKAVATEARFVLSLRKNHTQKTKRKESHLEKTLEVDGGKKPWSTKMMRTTLGVSALFYEVLLFSIFTWNFSQMWMVNVKQLILCKHMKSCICYCYRLVNPMVQIPS